MNVPGNPDASVVAWMRAAAIPLATVEPRQGWNDLAALRNIIGDARILSLGEATHGTREFFKLKHRIVEYCVAELACRAIRRRGDGATASSSRIFPLKPGAGSD